MVRTLSPTVPFERRTATTWRRLHQGHCSPPASSGSQWGGCQTRIQQLLLPASPESLPYNSTKSTLQQAILHVVTDAQAASPHAAPQQACLAAPHMLTTLLLSQSYPNTLTDPTPLELRPHPTRMCSDRSCFPVRFHCVKAQKVVGRKQRVFVLSRTHKRDNPSPTTRDAAHKRRVAKARHALRTKRAHAPRGQAAHACKSVIFILVVLFI